MSYITETIVPAKFLSLISQVVMTITIVFTRKDHIYTALGNDASESSSEFEDAEASLLACVTLALIFNAFEVGVLFSGVSLFHDKVNISEIFLHCVGVILLSWFILDDWTYEAIWAIWAFTSLVPFLLEILVVATSKRIYKVKT